MDGCCNSKKQQSTASSPTRSSCVTILLLTLAFTISHSCFIFFSRTSLPFYGAQLHHHQQQQQQQQQLQLRVYVAQLPSEFSYGLIESYSKQRNESHRGYPEEPLFKQHSAEYWLLKDLESGEQNSVRQRVWNSEQADIVFVPFFASLSAQLLLRGSQRGNFRKASREKNSDFHRQRRVVDFIKSTPEWRRSDGRDHVFALADPMAMWHVRQEVANSIFLVVDFGGWYMEDAKYNSTSAIIQHTQVSLIKDVVVPHTHLLPTLHRSNDQPRKILLYFRGARHRHRGGLVREKLWKILQDEAEVVLESGLPNATGVEQASRGMRSSEFCLDPAGDTPGSCRLYDAIASLCIPVIVSDDVELPFEGMLDYTKFSVFASSREAVRAGWLVKMLRSISSKDRELMREEMSRVQSYFEYSVDGTQQGAVNFIWQKVSSKLPLVREAVSRYRRRAASTVSGSASKRCHCVS